MRIYFIHQDVGQLRGEYMISAMVVAPDHRAAVKKLLLAANVLQVGIYKERLTVIDCGPAPQDLLNAPAREILGDVRIMAIDIGMDEGD